LDTPILTMEYFNVAVADVTVLSVADVIVTSLEPAKVLEIAVVTLPSSEVLTVLDSVSTGEVNVISSLKTVPA